ncbi:MAG: 2-C-methyl-D-erythritol 4-phosphate cytidylyltransferase [Tepidisphaerales bacterium]
MSEARLIAVIPAAGRSVRYRAAGAAAAPAHPDGKLAELLHGRTVLAWSVAAFLRRADVSEVVVATSDIASCRALLGELADDPRLTLTLGGACRAASVLAGLQAARTPVTDAAWVAVHDAARPALSDGLIDEVWAAARRWGAAAPALPVTLTVRTAAGPLPSPAGRTVPRETLYAMQTPQIARREVLRRALEGCAQPLEQVTDELMALELAGLEAWLVPGEAVNLKVTVPDDLAQLRQCWTPRCGPVAG